LPQAPTAYGRTFSRSLEGKDGEEVGAQSRKLIDRMDFYLLECLGRFGVQVHGSLAVLLGI